jgi:hypothetical protein
MKDDLRAGTHVLNVFGALRYRDVFGKTQTLEWRLYIGGDNPIDNGGGNLAVYPYGGNNAT